MSYAAALWRVKPLTKGGMDYDKAKKTLILCVHDGSFTGAPILGWNLARELSKTHNVVCIMLANGKLAVEFRPFCVAFVVPLAGSIGNANPKAFARRVLQPICDRFGVDYILANSIESEISVSSGAILGIPSVALVHEFAEYTYPPRLLKVLDCANAVIFSSELLVASARNATGRDLAEAIVAPQGKCDLPASDSQSHSDQLDALLAELVGTDTFLCIGCGHVQIRKGVDLFIAAATQVLERGVKAKFIWVGDGYDPDGDYALSVWLKDQIERGGHSTGIKIIPSLHAADLEKLYQRSDIMFLSSRLDPLPNVAIDALSAGVPVVCFAKASGFPGYFEEEVPLNYLVVPYFDFGAAADKIFEVANDRQLRDELSRHAVRLARRRFDMHRYVTLLVDRLEEISAKPAGER
ncbi:MULTISPECIES: glycosyltransferase family 4 protein [unclassified Rhizobium]